MKLLIQRVRQARVEVMGNITGQIDKGLLVFVGFEKGDTNKTLQKLANKLLAYRVFPDSQGRMNCNVQEALGALLVVSQFTIAANTQKGLRPSFTPAAEPAIALQQYNEFLGLLKENNILIQQGEYGADMQVHLVNDGPVTFLLESK